MTEDRPYTLKEVAQAHAQATAELAEAEAEIARLRGPYDAARQRANDIEDRIERLELAMTTAKRMYFITQAMAEASVKTDDPAVIVVPPEYDFQTGEVYEMVAVASDGTALYLHTPKQSHRYQGKTYAVRDQHVAEDHQGRDDRSRHFVNITRDNQKAIGLLVWQERGAGSYGKGSGAVKPLAPPNGGRWKWLKVREQSDLPVGT